MPTWIPVSGQRILRRLKSVRAESNIQCFELESTHGSLDGPWSYLLFVVDSLQPCILTMYIAEIHEEALVGGFNPFDGATGIVLLEDEVQGLITLLEAQLDILDESQSIIDHPFQLLEESEYKYFHINKEQSSLSKNIIITKLSRTVTAIDAISRQSFYLVRIVCILLQDCILRLCSSLMIDSKIQILALVTTRYLVYILPRPIFEYLWSCFGSISNSGNDRVPINKSSSGRFSTDRHHQEL